MYFSKPIRILPEEPVSVYNPKPIMGWVWSLQRQISFISLVTILVLAAVIQLWNYRTFYNAEIERTHEKHLVIAQNVSLSLSRYVTDVARVFVHMATDVSNNDSPATRESQRSLLESLHVTSMVLLPSFQADAPPPIRLGNDLPLPEQVVLDNLRTGTVETLGGVQISGLQRIGDDKYFILGYELADKRLAVGYMKTDYIKSVQQAIAFGEFGHSAIFDQFGRAIAHPSPRVEENMVDASGISAVQRMLNGETGVEMFFSPPMQMDMIAGITVVPETGWPVMVPQPIFELAAAVREGLSKSYLLIIIMAVLLGVAGWGVSSRLARPVKYFTEISRKISEGDYTVQLPDQERSSIEMWQLNDSLKKMINYMRSSNIKLSEALRLEEEENKRQSDFLVIAGHELRTPLSGVVGLLTICCEQKEDVDRELYLDLAYKSAKELNRLVDHLVDYAKGHSYIPHLNPTTFDIDAEMRGVEAIYGNLARKAGLEFHCTGLGYGNTQIVSDKLSLMQMITKILENALKFTEDGNITLHSEIIQQDERKWLKVAISDTGIGIDEADLERIFMPFEQVDKCFARSYGGLGIGLYIATEIAKRTGARVKCSSKLGEGSRFEILTPIELVQQLA
ncbi:MAG: ATP-binding protein [Loktanella sp.]|nr:ATP-binding protein [Loktanella sp.]